MSREPPGKRITRSQAKRNEEEALHDALEEQQQQGAVDLPGETPFQTPSSGPDTWADTLPSTAEKLTLHLKNVIRRPSRTPTVSSLSSSASEEAMASGGGNSGEGQGDHLVTPRLLFLAKVGTRKATILSEGERDAESAIDEWRIASVDHLKSWVSEDPDKVLDMINTLRAERDEGAIIAEEDAGQNLVSEDVKDSEIRKLRVTEMNLKQMNANITNQLDGLVGRVGELTSENATLREHQREMSVATTGDKKKKTTKMRDPPIFTGAPDSDVKYEDWELAISDRFVINYDHFDDDHAKVVFMCNSTGGDALEHTRNRRGRDAIDPYKSPHEVFDHLGSIYGEVDKIGTARRSYKATYQGVNGKFAGYKSNMMRLASILKYGESQVRDDLVDQMAPRLKDALRNNPHIRHSGTMKDMCDWLQQLDNDQLADIEKKKSAAARRTTAPNNKDKDTSTVSTGKREPSKKGSGAGTYNINSYTRNVADATRIAVEKRLGLCHNCHQPGHMQDTCPELSKNASSTNQIEEVNDPKN